jgi:hypothetical protein
MVKLRQICQVVPIRSANPVFTAAQCRSHHRGWFPSSWAYGTQDGHIAQRSTISGVFSPYDWYGR